MTTAGEGGGPAEQADEYEEPEAEWRLREAWEEARRSDVQARVDDSVDLHRALGLEPGELEWHRLIERVTLLREGVEHLHERMEYHSGQLHPDTYRPGMGEDARIVLFAKWGSVRFWGDKVAELLRKVRENDRD